MGGRAVIFESQGKGAVDFAEGIIVIPILSKTFCTAHSSDSGFVMILIICPKKFL